MSHYYHSWTSQPPNCHQESSASWWKCRTWISPLFTSLETWQITSRDIHYPRQKSPDMRHIKAIIKADHTVVMKTITEAMATHKELSKLQAALHTGKVGPRWPSIETLLWLTQRTVHGRRLGTQARQDNSTRISTRQDHNNGAHARTPGKIQDKRNDQEEILIFQAWTRGLITLHRLASIVR